MRERRPRVDLSWWRGAKIENEGALPVCKLLRWATFMIRFGYRKQGRPANIHRLVPPFWEGGVAAGHLKDLSVFEANRSQLAPPYATRVNADKP